MNHLPSSYQVADIMTKPLSKKKFVRFKQELKVTEFDSNKKGKIYDNNNKIEA